MGNLQVFNHKEFGEVRTIILNDVIWFVGIDATRVLGYSNSYDALKKHVDNVDKDIIQNSHFASFEIDKLEIPNRGLVIINESGLYSLMLRSKLPSARKFQRWITSEVIPKLRRTGQYNVLATEVQSEAVAVVNDDMLILAKANMILENLRKEHLQLLSIKDSVIEEKEKVIEHQEKVIEENEMFINQIAVSKNSIRVRDLAQLCCKNGINIGQNRLFEQLRIWQMIGRKDNTPYQRYMDMGLFEIVEFPVETSKGIEIKRSLRVTGKGQEYIVVRLMKERLKEGMSPVVR